MIDERDGGLSVSTGVLIAAFAVVVLCWALALSEATAADPPVLLVRAEPTAAVGGELFVRVVAVAPGGKERLDEPLLVELRPGGAAEKTRLSTTVAAPDVAGTSSLVVALVGEPGARVEAPVAVVSTVPGEQPVLRFRPWRREVLRGGAGPPIYPMDGRVLSTLTSEVLLLEDEAVRLAKLTPNPAETRDGLGRVLALDRRDLQVRVPLEVEPGGEVAVDVTTAGPEDLTLDLIVDGRSRGGLDLHVGAGTSAVALQMPSDVPRGAPFWVHVVDRPYASAVGPTAIGRVAGGEMSLREFAVELAGQAGAGEDPLAARLASAAPVDDEPAAVRALLARITPQKRRAPPFGTTATQQREASMREKQSAVDAWRTPLRAAGLVFSLAAPVVAWRTVRRTRRRLQEANEASDADGGAGDDDEGMDLSLTHRGAWSASIAAALAVLAMGLLPWVLDWTLGFAVGE